MDSELLKVLCCPICYGAIVVKDAHLTCKSCGQQYPILDGIPDMRVYESETFKNKLDEEQARYEADLHDKEAESDYEKSVIRTFGTKTRLMVENWVKDQTVTTASVILDYGCGTGQVSRVMAHHYVKPLYAFDISEKSLRKNMQENGVLGVLANSLYLPFQERSFDVVCINGVLHHIVDLERAVCELARVSGRSVYVSEGIPRDRPSLGMALLYPGFNRKIAYLCYLSEFWMFRLFQKGKSGLKRLLALRFRRDRNFNSHNSKYERPLYVKVVESLMEANGFRRNRLQYYTNIDIPGDGAIKNMLTRVLVNDVVGTHFDLRMDRVCNSRTKSDQG